MTGVLVARLDNAGDVLLAGPAVRAAATAGPVTLLCGPGGRAAADLLPGVAAVEVFDAPWVALEPPPVERAAVEDLLARLAGAAVDEAAVLTSFHQSPLPLALLLRLAGIPRIAATCEDHPGALLDVRHRIADRSDGGPHEVERGLSLLAAMGHHLPPGDDGRLRVRTDLLGPPALDEPYVVVHPGASVPARGLDVGRAARIVAELVRRGRRVVVTGGPSEAGATATSAAAGGAAAVDLGGCTDLAALGGVLAGAAALVAGNTGPAHLAAAVGTPVVSVFAPVVPAARWAPWGVPVELLGDQEVPCAGCRARTCPIPGQPCLGPATPAAVAAAVDRLAGRAPVTADPLAEVAG
jgi:ADP-heptose:LPS heptosyltransferase